MNKCQFYCNYIGNKPRSAGGGGGGSGFDFQAAWQDIVDTCASNQGKEYTDSYTTFGEIAGSNKWSGGVLADNGYIYSCRNSVYNLLKLSYTDDSFSTVTFNKGTSSYGGSFAPNKTIYYSYSNGLSSVKPYFTTLNTANDEPASFQPDLTGSANNPAFIGSILAPNGYIYYIPYNSTVIIKINPKDNSSVVFGELPTGSKWDGGVLAPNGCIYGVHKGKDSILKINTNNDEVMTFGSVGSKNEWSGGVLAPNGCIYCIPFSSTSILKIDPSDDTYTTFGSFSGSLKWRGGVLAPNGCIYGIPYGATSILKINTNNDTATTFGDLQGSYKWWGGILAPNGRIYGIPYCATSILKIDPGSSVNTNFQTNTLLSPYLNKY